jgi:hypothetical protein
MTPLSPTGSCGAASSAFSRSNLTAAPGPDSSYLTPDSSYLTPDSSYPPPTTRI